MWAQEFYTEASSSQAGTTTTVMSSLYQVYELMVLA